MSPQEIIELMTMGKATTFWKEVVKHLESRAKFYEDRILDDEELEPEKERILKSRRAVYLYLVNLPDILIRMSTPGEKAKEKYDDIYE